jgi:hypothetical protein
MPSDGVTDQATPQPAWNRSVVRFDLGHQIMRDELSLSQEWFDSKSALGSAKQRWRPELRMLGHRSTRLFITQLRYGHGLGLVSVSA